MDTLLEEIPNNEDPENKSNIDQGKNKKIEMPTQQTPNNEIKQEPVDPHDMHKVVEVKFRLVRSI